MTTAEKLRDKANSLPEVPGVYLMKNADGKIIYVGKSKKLKNRVTSYFDNSPKSVKTQKMASLVFDFDYIVCDTEMEALTLENVLIKRHVPKYNIKLKDAKSYPYIKVTAEEYPRLIVTRERKSDKGRYFGPYSGTAQAYTALDTVRKIFSIPTCKRQFPRDFGKERPCIYLDMGRCLGLCRGNVPPEEYRRRIRGAEEVLSGRIKETVATLERGMRDAAERLDFEEAAGIRDSIAALGKLLEKQKVVGDAKINRDVFALYLSEAVGVLSLLCVREGAVVSKNEFVLSGAELTENEDALSLIADYYDGAGTAPAEIILDFAFSEEDLTLLSDYLSYLSKRKVHVRMPERGEGRKLCDLALENAEEAARQYRLTVERESKNVLRLREVLGLSEIPRRIEAYDISNIGNEAITASMVVTENGRFKKSDYRVFTVKTTEGADDYGAMREVLSRRFSHIGDGTPSLGEVPDLILLDGGDAHVGVGRAVLAACEVDIPIYGMVKDDFHKTRAITDGANEISIALEPDLYTFVYNIQEEAHRFAVKNSQKNKTNAMTHSTLERIPGIGPAKARALLSAMPLGEIRRADAEKIAAVAGIGKKDAEAVYRYFHKE